MKNELLTEALERGPPDELTFGELEVWATIKKFAKEFGWDTKIQQRAWNLFEDEGGVVAFKALFGAQSQEWRDRDESH